MEIEEAVRRFLNAAAIERNLSRLTIKAYTGDLRRFQKSIATLQIETVTIEDLRKSIESMEKAGTYQDTTIRRHVATLKAFFKFLEEEQIVEDSPARRLRGHYTVTRRLPRVMTPREIRGLLRSCRRRVLESETAERPHKAERPFDSPSFRALRDLATFELLFATGMRIGELVALDISDVNLQDGTVRILGKGRRERMAFISSDEALQAVRDYTRFRLALPSLDAALILNKVGRRLTIYSVENAFRRSRRVARIRRGYTPHCLRHTMATMLLNNGADIRSVQEILGHRTIVTTQIYTEVSIGQKRKTMVKFHERNRMRLNLQRMESLTPPVPMTAATAGPLA